MSIETLIPGMSEDELESLQVNGLGWSGIDDAAYPVLAGKLHAVVDGFERNLELHDHAVDGL